MHYYSLKLREFDARKQERMTQSDLAQKGSCLKLTL